VLNTRAWPPPNDNAVVPNYKYVVRQADTPGTQDKIVKIVSFGTEEH
jgi:hypothetical protein